jgi:methylated-DNA-[protein]-cysteine S-methyltransferase
MTIYTSFMETPLGMLEITASDEFVCAVNFRDSPKRKTVPLPESEEKSDVLLLCISQLGEYFEGSRKDFTVPIQQEGTEFQQNVWGKLVTIPYAKTMSYLELSRKIGNEKAIRAVGTTNGKNQIAIIVPCHRVIGSNGTLVGYAGELWRKKWLLEHEAKQSGEFQMSLF